VARRCCGDSRSRLKVGLGGRPLEVQMRLDSSKKAKIMIMPMIRCFIEK
jgi:hypothetical protein